MDTQHAAGEGEGEAQRWSGSWLAAKGRRLWDELSDSALHRRHPPASVPRLPGGDPLLGHLRAMRSDRIALQHRVATRFPDLVCLPIGLFEVVMVSSPELAQAVLVEHEDAFVKSQGLSVFARPLLGNGLLTSEGQEHRRQRRMMAPLFTQRHIATYAEEMITRAERWSGEIAAQREVDFAAEAMRVTLDIVGKTLFGSEMAFEASAVGQALTTAMEVMMSALTGIVPVPPSVPTPGHRRARKAIAHLDELVYRIIAERRARPGDRTDVLTLLLAARDEDGTRMSDTQVRDEAMTLFLAGHETTANALFWTLLLLAENPEARAEIEAEIDAVLGERPLRYEDLPRLPLTLAALKEGMRLYPPAYILGRRAVREVKLGGHTLLPNTVVFINIAGMHRRPDLFPDAGRFELRRFEGNREKSMPRYAYMPFGAGPRICIGNHFALMEGHILLATLLRRVRLARPRDEVGTTPLITLRPRGDTRMAVTRRR